MKIGIFDSGLGGLFIAKHIMAALPQYDYVYLADTAHLPYGTRSQAQIYELTRRAVKYLFEKHNCVLVILACNTASSQALRKLQREYLPRHFSGRRILGVIIPSVEDSLRRGAKRVGILATPATVASRTFIKEFHLAAPRTRVFQQAAPLLVPMIERGELPLIKPVLKSYLAPLLARKIDTVVLGCTHYGILKFKVRALVGPRLKIISQAEVVPEKLVDYLKRHPEMETRLSRHRKKVFLVTSLSKDFASPAREWFGKKIALRRVQY